MASPIIYVLPASQEKLVLGRISSATNLENFEWWDKFVYFGDPPNQSSGNVTDAQSNKKVYWFGLISNKTLKKANVGANISGIKQWFQKSFQAAPYLAGVSQDIWSSATQAGNQSVSYAAAAYKNIATFKFPGSLNTTGGFRYTAFTTIQELFAKGNPRISFVSAAVPVSSGTPSNPPNPSPRNVGVQNAGGNYDVQIQFGDIDLYLKVLSKVLETLDNQIKKYNITFDKPFNALYYSGLIPDIKNKLIQIALENESELGPGSILSLTFSGKLVTDVNDGFKELVSMNLKSSNEGPLTWKKLRFPENMFNNQTVNFLIYNLPAIYNRYNLSYQNQMRSEYGSIFKTQDEIRTFVNKYFIPAPSLAISNVTKSIIERFILGDARLMDDEYYNKYQVTREDMPAAFKQNLNKEVAQQYEAIGDFLGDQWLSGKFQEIRSLEDVYDQLLDYISVPDLIKLAVKCLLKMMPLEDLLDAICKPVLQAFDEHKEAIIGELEKMDSGIGKDLARELTQIYFELVEEGTDYSQQLVTQSAVHLQTLINDCISVSYWSNANSLGALVVRIRNEAARLIKMLGVGETSIEARKLVLAGRIANLEAEHTKLSDRVKVFAGNVPEGQQSALDYYTAQIAKLNTQHKKLERAAKNTIEQLRLYNFIIPLNLDNHLGSTSDTRPTQGYVNAAMLALTNNHILPNLILLDPYLKSDEKGKLITEVLGIPFSVQLQDKAIQNLKNFDIPNSFATAVANPITSKKPEGGSWFTFGNNYNNLNDNNGEKKNIFDLNLVPLKQILQHIDELNDVDSAPEDILNSMANFGANTMDAYFDEVFNDPDGTKRYYLCLAIYGAVPAVGYLVYQLIADWEESAAWIEDQAKAIYDGFSKRIEMFARIDYPITDILKELGDSLMQMASNFARDILINGILMTIGMIRQACEDEEKVNAPYSPMGAVDLSSFMINSKKGLNGAPTGAVEDSSSFKQTVLLAPDISVDQFQTILSTLSSAFSIREMCAILKGKAASTLYLRAIATLQSIPSLEGTRFYNLYVNEMGIREFFKLISKDIEPAFCAQAIDNYNKEKSILLEICFGRDDSALEELLCKDMSPEECLKLLSSRADIPTGLLGKLVDQMGGLFKYNQSPDPCENGEGIFDDSQLYSADKIGNSLFGAIDTSFESDISKIKDIYKDLKTVYKNQSLFSSNPDQNKMRDIINESLKPKSEQDSDIIKSLKSSLEATPTSQGKVGLRILEQVQNKINELEFTADSNRIIFKETVEGLGKSKNKREIKFEYDPNAPLNNTKLEISTGTTVSESGAAKPGEDGETTTLKKISNVLASYSANKYEYIENKEERIPERILFNPQLEGGGIAVVQPQYNTELKENIGQFCLDNDYYMTLLNSILKDLFANTFKAGLYNKEEFQKLNLNKHIPYKNVSSDKLCFLGFVNKKVLNKQMQEVAKKLTCYAPESATKGPVNVAMVKIALDCVVRIIAIKEMMKSLFVYGIFPSELPFDDERSFYDQYINNEIQRAIESQFSSGGENLTNFYKNVVIDFIADIMRILYQKEDMTPQESYDILRETQVNFAKQQLIHTVSSQLSSSANKPSEYQLVESALNPQNNANQDPYLAIKTLSYSDRIQALQNDYLTLFLDTFDYKHDEGLNRPTQVIIPDDATNRAPTFVRTPTRELKFYNYNNLELEESSNLGTILQGIDNGIALEKMVEVKYNSNFISSLTGTDVGKHLYDFLIALGNNKIILFPIHRNLVKHFLYETKLIMLFPQLAKIVNSFDVEAGQPGALWGKHLDENGNFNLFAQMYVINFGVTALTSAEQPQSLYLEYQQALLDNDDLENAFTGKFYMNDFETLINNFSYGSYPTENSLQQLWEYVVDITPWEFGDEVINDSNDLYREPWVKLMWSTGTEKNNLEAANWGAGNNFFQWLFAKSINDILEISTVLRLSAYIKPEPDNFESEMAAFEASIFPPVSGDSSHNHVRHELLKEKIGHVKFRYDKPAGEDMDGTPDDDYICFPVFETKQLVPNIITWSDFFLDLHKDLYKDPEFYTRLTKFINADYPSGNWKLNELLFPDSDPPIPKLKEKDVFSYFHRLKSTANLSMDQQKNVFVHQYVSTQWFNIKGRKISKETILDHFAKGTEAKKLVSGLDFTSGDFYDNKDGTKNPFAYLTDASLASLNENHWYFIDPETGDFTTDPKKLWEIEDNPTYDDNSAFPSALYNAASGVYYSNPHIAGNSISLKVGEWDIKNLDTGEIIKEKAPKFIRIANLFESKTEPEKMSWIDFGWYGLVDQSYNATQDLQEKYPGTWFDERFEFSSVGLLAPVGPTIEGTKIYDTDPNKGPAAKTPANRQFFGGYVNGGLISENLIETPVDLGANAILFNAYEMFGKLLLASPEGIQTELFERLLKSFFIKEQTTIIALLHRIYAEKYYPEIETVFDSSIDTAINILLAAVASANGDYQHTSRSNSTANVGPDVSSLDFGMIAGQLLKMFFGAMANTVDPTWKTDWFAPGPFTPFGIAAKILDEQDFSSSPDKATKTRPERKLPAECDDQFAEQTEFFKFGKNVVNEDNQQE